MPKPSEIFDTPEAISRVGGNEEISIDITSHLAGVLPSGLYDRLENDILKALTTKDKEKEEVIGRILGLKINMPSEREYSTNPTSAYRTGFEQAVSIYRDRIKSLTHRG